MRTCYKATNNKHWRNRQRVKWDWVEEEMKEDDNIAGYPTAF